MSTLNPTEAEVAAWTRELNAALPVNALSARLAASCFRVALEQQIDSLRLLSVELLAERSRSAEQSRLLVRCMEHLEQLYPNAIGAVTETAPRSVAALRLVSPEVESTNEGAEP